MLAVIPQHLTERRQFGADMVASRTNVMRFARYAEVRHHRCPLTCELIVGWAREHVKRTSAVAAALRQEVMRTFAAYYRQFEPITEILPPGILGRGHRRLVSRIYADEEVEQLLQAARRLTPYGGLRPSTYHTLFGLIAAAGLRLSEPLNLNVGDIDLDV